MVEQINPPSLGKAQQPRILLGLAKDEDEDKGKKKAKPKKPPQKSKEAPPKPIKWADSGPKPIKQGIHYIDDARKNLAENVFPLNIRGTQGNPGIAPCIIKEVYFPPEAPYEVATLIESALVYQNTANYELAVNCFEMARKAWLNELKDKDVKTLKTVQELFFALSIASVYESAGKDDLALQYYMNAKEVSQKLPFNHPDLAFAYCGLGSVAYHMEEPSYALRLFLKAKEIRERTLGGDTVDTATVYNNLGCCMFFLERNEEAKGYFDLANAILECELGPQHERTLTSLKNLTKIKKSAFRFQVPEFRPLYYIGLPHPAPKAKKKGKAKKGKKKK